MATDKRKTDPNNVTINFTLRLDDENPKIRKIASMLREGRAIDRHGLFVTKGKDLCMYALEVFDHLSSQPLPVVKPSEPDDFFPKVTPRVSPSDVYVQKTEDTPDVKDALAGMGLEDFVNG